MEEIYDELIIKIKNRMKKETTLSEDTYRMISLASNLLNQLWMESAISNIPDISPAQGG